MLNDTLSSDPEIEVVATAPSAEVALAKLNESKPDVVTLDVEMPDVSGLELLVEIRKRAPHLPVIMFSSLTERAAVATLDALARGASDYVTKPTGATSRETAMEQVREQLVPKIKALGRRAPAVATPRAIPKATRTKTSEPRILAIGASTGGPNALSALISKFDSSFPLPIVITQHMPPVFTQFLAERLRAVSGLDCREACDNDVLKPGVVLVAPGDFHLTLKRRGEVVTVALDRAPPENSCRPSVDVMFRSVEEAYGAATLAVVLTGMGQDGLRGAEQIHASGGQILVQDQASSIVWGMPGCIARAGLADAELEIPGLAAAISERVKRKL
jgi:two-component system chemotaxis response regulator CheB